MFKNALVSVSDKTGLVEFLKPLVARGLRVVSTGGTAKHLEDNGIAVTHVSQQTGFPEVMDGRVRTLHPHIHMALLGRTQNSEDMALLKKFQLEPFDLVIGNLYPFEAQLEDGLSEDEMVEYIDIGGPALLRAASKNFHSITVVCDPKDYANITEKSGTTIDERRQLAAKVFSHISAYDSMITRYLNGDKFGETMTLAGELVQELRYGENPQQKAAWYRCKGASGLHDAQILQGKALSYNNILDLDAAIQTLREHQRPTVVAVKHNNPCGVGSHEDPMVALERAVAADPVSVFGGIIAMNSPLTLDGAKRLASIFLECVVTPMVTDEARQELERKKNLRVLVWPKLQRSNLELEIKTVAGGFLVQTADVVTPWQSDWKLFGEMPSADVKRDLEFAWRVCRHLKSNAIAIASGEMTLGLGMGQVNRVEAVEHAIARLKHHHPMAQRPVLASDAFFPFPDSIERIAQAGIHWVIQPGGSVKDQEVIECAQRLGVNLVMTGERHFRH